MFDWPQIDWYAIQPTDRFPFSENNRHQSLLRHSLALTYERARSSSVCVNAFLWERMETSTPMYILLRLPARMPSTLSLFVFSCERAKVCCQHLRQKKRFRLFDPVHLSWLSCQQFAWHCACFRRCGLIDCSIDRSIGGIWDRHVCVCVCGRSARVFRAEDAIREFEKQKREFMQQFGFTPIPMNQVISPDDLLAWLPRDLFVLCVSFYHTYVPLKVHLFEPVLSMLRCRLHIYPGGHCHCNRYLLWSSGATPCNSRGVHYLALEKLVTQNRKHSKRQQRRHGRRRRRKRRIRDSSVNTHHTDDDDDDDDKDVDGRTKEEYHNATKANDKSVKTMMASKKGTGQKPIKRRRVDGCSTLPHTFRPSPWTRTFLKQTVDRQSGRNGVSGGRVRGILRKGQGHGSGTKRRWCVASWKEKKRNACWCVATAVCNALSHMFQQEETPPLGPLMNSGTNTILSASLRFTHVTPSYPKKKHLYSILVHLHIHILPYPTYPTLPCTADPHAGIKRTLSCTLTPNQTPSTSYN